MNARQVHFQVEESELAQSPVRGGGVVPSQTEVAAVEYVPSQTEVAAASRMAMVTE